METMRMRVPIRLSLPGATLGTLEQSVDILALVDTAANCSCVPSYLIASLYGGQSIPSIDTVVWSLGGTTRVRMVPLTIGVRTTSGDLVRAQVNCAELETVSETLIGNDVLKQLGLRVVLDYKENQVLLESYGWKSFEQEVAALYRSLGAQVKQNVKLAGFQIDMVVEETTASRHHLRLAIECKFYKEQVGNRIVNDFGRILETLRQSSLIDKGVIVSSSGFSQDARLVAEKLPLDLVTIDDLRQEVASKGVSVPPIPLGKPRGRARSLPATRGKRPLHVFVIMPFTPELDDVYHLGIHEVIAKLGASCERADELQYVGGVIEKVYDSIKEADVIVVELSMPNPNVYYELGYAHALRKPTVLLTHIIQSSPFDLRGYNHVIYQSIRDLKERLERILRELFASDAE